MTKPLRILYVDVNAAFLNPTRSLIPLALMGAGDLHLFGPGYVSAATLERGLAAYADEAGPFDVALTNSHVLFADIYGAPVSPEQFRRFYSFSFPAEQVLHLPRMAADFMRLSLPRVGLFLESDYYNWSAREIERLDAGADCVIGFGPEFTPDWHLSAEVRSEAFGKRVTDAWPRYARERKDRIASLVHFVSDTEFSFDRLEDRPHVWSVLGINYHARKLARDALVRGGVKVMAESPVRRGIGLAKKLKLMRNESRRVLNFLNSDFQARLASARYSYTCGSALRMPIRKFFEIPAAGAVTVCQPFEGFAAAGFRDGENAVCCEPADIMDAHRMLEGDPVRAQRIADAGRKLVAERHSLSARAGQFKDVLGAVAQRRFSGASWASGEFVVRSPA